MQQCIHYDESFAPVASIESIQGKHVFVLDVRNVFQNTIQFNAQKSTYNMLPRLHWPNHPNFEAITTDPHLYVIQNFRSMQGKKDAGHLWYHLLKGAFKNIGLHRSVADHSVFVSKECESDMFVAIATDECLCLVDDCAQFLHLKTRME
jgi:hypothetical protein